MPRGRPSTYTEEMGEKICEALASGQTLNDVCAQEGMPCRLAVFAWVEKYPAFADRYRQARKAQSELLAEGAYRLALDGSDNPASDKIRLDATRWLLPLLNPKYAPKPVETVNTHKGDPTAPLFAVFAPGMRATTQALPPSEGERPGLDDEDIE